MTLVLRKWHLLYGNYRFSLGLYYIKKPLKTRLCATYILGNPRYGETYGSGVIENGHIVLVSIFSDFFCMKSFEMC